MNALSVPAGAVGNMFNSVTAIPAAAVVRAQLLSLSLSLISIIIIIVSIIVVITLEHGAMGFARSVWVGDVQIALRAVAGALGSWCCCHVAGCVRAFSLELGLELRLQNHSGRSSPSSSS